MENYLDINKKAWNNRVDVHINSKFYDLESFMRGESCLPPLDIELLEDIKGKTILHLQCHFGMETISLARLGAKVTGVDFSEKAIEKARELSDSLHVEANFICCDIYQLPELLNEQFDIVYTSYGVINWLPDLNGWGKVISSFLKPSGKFVMVEFHPILWMFDEKFEHIIYSYSRKTPYVMEEATYTDGGDKAIDKIMTWNYGLSEPINGLAKNGIRIEELNEYYESSINISEFFVDAGNNESEIKGLKDKIPQIYSIVGTKV